ncbi:unnamed protein product [Medioppia subpectinata]|uniref:3-methyl-2-oxobutanoate hydroxymethyltransferase n=1 Tax=Medioppia subpectinata TaxID=1979941 RepID=A0A7R9Q4C8_9ACAR|nr:unnamed protein product [Medioppia subpectinata]CAG2111484.1 unnamed protein product [Medioppia subpectinata]
MNLLDFETKKLANEKITMLTCYDYTSARIVADTRIDCLLVGDSVAMTVHGFKHTVSATVDMMRAHTEAVQRGAPNKFIVSDLPFLSYRQSLDSSIRAVQALVQAGAHAVKLEGSAGNQPLIKHIVESGVPVMGHLGLTPQAVLGLGGYRVQGKTEAAAKHLLDSAFNLQDAGCFGLVLECIPALVAKQITQALAIPTIGIGAGPYCDGQVLVWQDMLGLTNGLKLTFVKQFLDGGKLCKESINEYNDEVKAGTFPQREHSY